MKAKAVKPPCEKCQDRGRVPCEHDGKSLGCLLTSCPWGLNRADGNCTVPCTCAGEGGGDDVEIDLNAMRRDAIEHEPCRCDEAKGYTCFRCMVLDHIVGLESALDAYRSAPPAVAVEVVDALVESWPDEYRLVELRGEQPTIGVLTPTCARERGWYDGTRLKIEVIK